MKKATLQRIANWLKVEAAGIETRANLGVSNCSQISCADSLSTVAAPALQVGCSNCQSLAGPDAEWHFVAKAWPRLPAHVQETIRSLVSLHQDLDSGK
jgi:hypothetical protein